MPNICNFIPLKSFNADTKLVNSLNDSPNFQNKNVGGLR